MQSLGNIVWQNFRRFKIELPHEQAMSLPGIQPRSNKTLVHTKTHPRMFRTVRFLTAKKVKITQMSINRYIYLLNCVINI